MHNILIVRPSAIGDVVMASPMLKVLKEAYPEAQLSWLVEPQVRPVLATNRYIDRLIEWPKAYWVSLWRERRYRELWLELRSFRCELRREPFDLVLDAQGLLRSRLLAWFAVGKARVGFDSKEPGRLLMTRIISRGADSDRMSSEYLHMIQEIGLDPGAFHPCIEVGAEDQAAAADMLAAEDVAGDFVAFAPFTTRPQKHWVAGHWAELATRIERLSGWPVILLGGPADREAAAEIVDKGEGKMINLAGRIPLAASMAVIKRASLLVGVDTGLTHMGPAFNRPTLALFGATCPYRKTSRPNTRVLYHEFPCSPCRRSPTCAGRYPCMLAISVDEVLASCAELAGGMAGAL